MTLSDRIALLYKGRLEQVATPQQIYHRPRTAYAAQFIGQTNLLKCRVEGGVAKCGPLAWGCAGPDGPATFSLRPESIRLASAPAPASAEETVRFRARLQSRSFVGAISMLEVVCGDGRPLLVTISGREGPQREAEFEFLAEDAVRVLDAEDG